MQGIWMLESWSQVAVMKCSRYQFCNLRRTSLPTLLSFDHSCQEKPWFSTNTSPNASLSGDACRAWSDVMSWSPRPTCFGALLKEGISIPQNKQQSEWTHTDANKNSTGTKPHFPCSSTAKAFLTLRDLQSIDNVQPNLWPLSNSGQSCKFKRTRTPWNKRL